ncbi:MAG: hypothetical protein JXB49_32420, partial [Bacteroidales bacterium]|nr:hypothetical protein [Bacteroidales bacterium]
MKKLFVVVFIISLKLVTNAQALDFTAVKAEVDFKRVLREWDGFGINYVECAQTFNYEKYPQDYGGFDVLSEKDKQQIIQLVFGNEGLRPNIIKMFLDPLHQKTKGGAFDHETTTESMRYFAKQGYKLTKKRNDTLSIITTLYGPPAYITKQKILRGRDLDPNRKKDLCNYMIDWARYLKEEEYLPVKYISLHNEGESWLRFPQDGTLGTTADEGHDYNFFWSPEQVNEIMVMTRKLLNKYGLYTIGVTNGEPTNWYRFSYWGFADKMYTNKEIMNATAIVTSHGFYVGEQSAGRWFGPHSSKGIDLLRTKRPDLKAWCTSTSWDSKDMTKVVDGQIVRRYIMDAGFVKEIHGNIYEAKVNAIIPWAFIQKASHWNKPDPNPGSAIRVYDDETWEIKKGYYYYKQLTTAGRAGMNVVETSAMDSEIAIIGFEKNGTSHPNSFVVINYGKNDKLISL